MKIEIWVAVDNEEKLIDWHKHVGQLIEELPQSKFEQIKYIARAEMFDTELK